MCLAVPGKVVTASGDRLTRLGRVRFGGIEKEVNLAFVPEAEVGDYVLVHVGVAIATIDEEEAARVFAYLDEIGETDELGSASPEARPSAKVPRP